MIARVDGDPLATVMHDSVSENPLLLHVFPANPYKLGVAGPGLEPGTPWFLDLYTAFHSRPPRAAVGRVYGKVATARDAVNCREPAEADTGSWYESGIG